MALGISPDQHSPRHLHDAADVLELRREHRLQQVMPALNDLLADDSSSGRHLLVLTDARGEILWRVGSPDVLRRADRLEFSEGADWSEAGIGTNAISEALVTGRPVQLFSAEHLVRTHHEWACTAAPITDPATGRLLGVLDVSGPLDTLSADTLRMVRCAVRVAEAFFGNARRRDLLGCLICPGCVPAAGPPAGCCRGVFGAARRQACRSFCRWEPGAADPAPGGDPGAAGFTRPGMVCRGTGL
jgi:transcriptional regulator of acetoin/glycerol metabolism